MSVSESENNQSAFFKASSTSNKFVYSRCVEDCKKTSKLFRFPKDDLLNSQWCNNSNIETSFGKKSTSRVCIAHFDKLFLGKKKLLANSIPTICLGHTENINLCYPTAKIKLAHVNKCAIKNCGGSLRTAKMFKFPSNVKLRDTWLQICNISNENVRTLYLCSSHFE